MSRHRTLCTSSEVSMFVLASPIFGCCPWGISCSQLRGPFFRHTWHLSSVTQSLSSWHHPLYLPAHVGSLGDGNQKLGLSDTDPLRQDGLASELQPSWGVWFQPVLWPKAEQGGLVLVLALPLRGCVPVLQSFHLLDLSFLTCSAKEYFNQPGLWSV